MTNQLVAEDLNTIATAAGISLNGFQMGDAAAVSADGLVICGGGYYPSESSYMWSEAPQYGWILDLRGCAASIMTQPAPQSTCPGGTASFTVGASGTLAFKWQWRPEPAAAWADLANGINFYQGRPSLDVTGAASAALNPRILWGIGGNLSFRCIVANNCGNTISDAALLAVCMADFNCDSIVEDSDFVIFAAAYDLLVCDDPAMPANCPADINGDGLVDDTDFVLFAAAYDALLCP